MISNIKRRIRPETKKEKYLAVLLLLTLAFSGVFDAGQEGTESLQEEKGLENTELVQSYRDLQGDYQTLQQEHNSLEQDYLSLKNRYENMNSTIEGSSISYQEYVSLENNYRSLQTRYRTEKAQNSGDVLKPPYVVADNRSYLISHYTLEGEKDSYRIGAETFESQIVIGNIMRGFSLEEMRNRGYDNYADRFNSSKYLEIGDYGNYYKFNPFIVPSNFGTVADNINQRYDSDERKIRAVWNLVTQLNTYSKELEETPRMPMETLLAGGGDCEDTVILAASILEAIDEDWEVQYVYMDSNNPEKPQDINHVALYVDTGEYATFMETTSDTEMAVFDSVDGYYVDVESPGRFS